MAAKKKSAKKKFGNPARQAQHDAMTNARSTARDVNGAGLGDARREAHWGVDLLVGGRPRTTPWFEGGLDEVRSSAGSLTAADGSLALTVAIARLVGGVFHRVTHEARRGLLLEEFVDHLMDFVLDELATGAADDPQEPARLAYGLAAMLPPTPNDAQDRAVLWNRIRRAARGSEAEFEPWLLEPPVWSATGRLWQLTDAYGGARRGVIAEIATESETGFYLWDADGCDVPEIVNAGWFDDVEHAAHVWRAWVGPAGAEAKAEPVTAVEPSLLRRDHLMGVRGGETPSTFDHWYLADRVGDLVARIPAVRAAGSGLPEGEGWEAEAERFTGWLTDQRGALAEDVRAQAIDVVEMWAQMTLPSTWSIVSPHRVWNIMVQIKDMFDDEWGPAVIGLLPDLIRFQAERGSATPEQVDRAVAVAERRAERSQDDCPGAH